MNNQVYSRYLYQILMEFGSVSIPSLGTFTLEYKDASFRNNKTLLSPPSTQVSFTRDDQAAADLLHLLRESGMNADDASKLQQSLINDYNAATLAQVPFAFDGFGTVINNTFLPTENHFFNRYHGLREISIKPVSTTVTHDEEYLYRLQSASKSTDKSGLNSYIWPLLIGFVVSLIILAWVFSAKEGNKPQLTKEPEVIVESEMEDIDTLETSMLITDDTLAGQEGKLQNSELRPAISEPIVDKKVQERSDAKPQVSAPSYQGNECVVIVGAFKNTNNANKLLKSITAKGYKTYTSEHDGFKRVGVSYDCSTPDPDAFKAKVKKVFHKDAWYLHDTL